MEGQTSFYNKSNGDKELVSLITEALMQIQMYYTTRKEKSKPLKYKEGQEIDLENVLISSSDLWISNMILKFEDLSNNRSNKITIENKDLNILKYLVDFYWFNMPTVRMRFPESLYRAFHINFSDYVEIEEQNQIKNKNILRLM